MLEVYTADELAQAIGVSQRTLYAYLSQGILPEGRRVGRQVVYTNSHLRYGLLARAFFEGGMGIEAVSKILNQISSNRIQTYAAPLAALVEVRTRLQEDLANATRQLKPAGSELDLQDMRLEDPIALQARIDTWQDQYQRLGRQLEEAFTEVREHVLTEATEGSKAAQTEGQSELTALRLEIKELTAAIQNLALVLTTYVERDRETKMTKQVTHERLHSLGDKNGVPQ